MTRQPDTDRSEAKHDAQVLTAKRSVKNVKEPWYRGLCPACQTGSRSSPGALVPGRMMPTSTIHIGKPAVLTTLTILFVVGCASEVKVNPPDPTRLDGAGQVRHFEGVTPEQVLSAAEAVLAAHRPQGRCERTADSLMMAAVDRDFYLIAGGETEERWSVVARKAGSVTAASVAMRIRGSGFLFPFGAGSYEYPQDATWSRREVRIDYGVFWHRLQCALRGAPWPECPEVVVESGFRYYEPLCRRYTVEASAAP